MSEPEAYLPEPDASAPPAADKKRSWRTLLLWVVLIVMFLTIWQFLTPEGGTARPPTPRLAPCEDTSSPWSTALSFFPGLAIVFLIVLLIWRNFGVEAEFNASQEPGLVALSEHRYAEALAIFESAAARWKGRLHARCVVRTNIAHTHLRAGRIDEAIAAYVEVERDRSVLYTSGPRLLATVELAVVYGLAGLPDAAERWIAECRARLARSKDERMFFAARLCLAEAVVACRRGNPKAAVENLERHWTKLRFSLTADAMRAVEVVRAFAEAQSVGVREQNVVAQRLVQLEPTVRGEFDYLGARWPEMQAFLASHDLVTR